MASNYDGLTRNIWTGTWSTSGTHPIVLSSEIRGGLRTISGNTGDDLLDIHGQQLEDGMIIYRQSDATYYQFVLPTGAVRDQATGEYSGIQITDFVPWSGGSNTALLQRVVTLETEVALLQQQVALLQQQVDPIVGNVTTLTLAATAVSSEADNTQFVIDHSVYNIDTVFSVYATDSLGNIVELETIKDAGQTILESNVDGSDLELEIHYLDTLQKADVTDTSGPFQHSVNLNAYLDSTKKVAVVPWSTFSIEVLESAIVTKYDRVDNRTEVIDVAMRFDYSQEELHLESNVELTGCTLELVVTYTPTAQAPDQDVGSDYYTVALNNTYFNVNLAANNINKIHSYRFENATGEVVSLDAQITSTDFNIESNENMSGLVLKMFHS